MLMCVRTHKCLYLPFHSTFEIKNDLKMVQANQNEHSQNMSCLNVNVLRIMAQLLYTGAKYLSYFSLQILFSVYKFTQ